MIRKLFTIIIMASIIAVGFVCKDSWLDVIRDGGVYSVLFSMLLVAACVFFPIVPFALRDKSDDSGIAEKTDHCFRILHTEKPPVRPGIDS